MRRNDRRLPQPEPVLAELNEGITMTKPRPSGAKSLPHGGNHVRRGENSSPKGEITFPRGETASRQGEVAFHAGETAFYEGETPFAEGEVAFHEGEMPFAEGETGFHEGKALFQAQNIDFAQRKPGLCSINRVREGKTGFGIRQTGRVTADQAGRVRLRVLTLGIGDRKNE